MSNLNLPKIQIFTTTRCNLKCKLCSAYSPYHKNPHDLNYIVFQKDIIRLFELVDKFERMELTGGEPLLNLYLPDMINFLRKFGNRINELRLLSNARILPSYELLEVIKKSIKSGLKFKILIDDYGPELSLSINESEYLYKSTGAEVSVRDYYSDNMHMGGWVDYGITSELKRTREQVIQEPKCTCLFPLQIRALFESVIYPCSRGIYYYADIAPSNTYPIFPSCVRIHDELKSNEQLREELLKFWQIEYYEVCSYCTGRVQQDTRRFIPAKQFI